MRSVAIAFTALAAAAANVVIGDTSLSVIPLGRKQNVIQKAAEETTATDGTVTIQNVRALWSALHGINNSIPGRRRLPTTEGMPIVPDLFSKPDNGLVVTLMMMEGSSVDHKENMPLVSNLLLENKSEVARPMTVESGSHGEALHEMAEIASYEDASTITSVMFQIKNNDDASKADEQIGKFIEKLKSDVNHTSLLHIVIDDSMNQLLSSSVVEDDDSDMLEATPRRKLQSSENATNADESTTTSSSSSNSSKTIFQIQYSQTCLWTTLGLFSILFFSMNLMANMPLMADTLLFGESAKMSAD